MLLWLETIIVKFQIGNATLTDQIYMPKDLYSEIPNMETKDHLFHANAANDGLDGVGVGGFGRLGK